jgi:hypothetical protein
LVELVLPLGIRDLHVRHVSPGQTNLGLGEHHPFHGLLRIEKLLLLLRFANELALLIEELALLTELLALSAEILALSLTL